MNTKFGLLLLRWPAAWLALAGITRLAAAGEPTAFDLVKEGNKHVGEEAKDRVVQIRSEKSIGTLTPNVWFVVYYDPDAALKATEVKFAAGRKVAVQRPFRLLEPISGADKQLPREKLRVDSDRALKTATSEPLLKNVKLTASRMKLERWGGSESPVWKIELWATKLRQPKDTVSLGEIFIAADDGKVVKNDLHIDRVD
jgi:hypothetical protein